MTWLARWITPAVEPLARRCFAYVLNHEGRGFVNDPKDPGGATKMGVSWRAVRLRDKDRNGLLDFDLDHDGDVDDKDIRAITEEDAWRLFVEDYWSLGGDGTPSSCTKVAEVSPAMAFILADGAYNMGARAAVAVMQRALGVPSDGLLGPQTLDAIVVRGRYGVMGTLACRLDYYRKLDTADRFFVGWARRSVEAGVEALA
jgi:lysozyme family protein